MRNMASLNTYGNFGKDRKWCRIPEDWPPGPLGAPGHREDALLTEEDSYAIFCAACNLRITDFESVMEVNGRHEHTFVNPAGVSFHIGCFSSARGCRLEGIPTGNFTWFSGYAWAYALCTSCRVHLGWHYSKGTGEEFYGLILARLVWAKTG